MLPLDSTGSPDCWNSQFFLFASLKIHREQHHHSEKLLIGYITFYVCMLEYAYIAKVVFVTLYVYIKSQEAVYNR